MKKLNSKSQKGRSMVEMLGVLSIIGVLSVGGISAYGVAMKKHKANELMAATMQEAVLISAQLATGKTNPTLSGINNSLFASASTVANSDNFKITLNTIDTDICTKMKSMLGVSSMVHAISDNCGEMIFNKNLTPKAVTQSGGSSGGNSGMESGGNTGGSGEGGSTEPEDPCADFEPTICMTECTNNNGVAEYTYAEEGTTCDLYLNSTSACDGQGNCNDCSVLWEGGTSAFACSYSKVDVSLETNITGCCCLKGTEWDGAHCIISGGHTGGLIN